MLDLDTFLTTLYVLVDDSIKSQPTTPPRPGQQPHLTESEVVTLALLAQWKQFASERAFVRYAVRHLRKAFPTMPHRTQLNRLLRDAHERNAWCSVAIPEPFRRLRKTQKIYRSNSKNLAQITQTHKPKGPDLSIEALW
ncbi:MAG: hypothetical protein ACJ8CR_09620 [Roseiflexaceae bacterium]